MKRAHKSCGCGSAPDCVHPSESLRCGGVISISTEYQLLCHCSQSLFVFLKYFFYLVVFFIFLLLKQEIKVDWLLACKVWSVCCSAQIAANLNSFRKDRNCATCPIQCRLVWYFGRLARVFEFFFLFVCLFRRCHGGRMPRLVKCHPAHVKTTRNSTNRAFSRGDRKQTSAALIWYARFLFAGATFSSWDQMPAECQTFTRQKSWFFFGGGSRGWGSLKDGGQNFEVCDSDKVVMLARLSTDVPLKWQKTGKNASCIKHEFFDSHCAVPLISNTNGFPKLFTRCHDAAPCVWVSKRLRGPFKIQIRQKVKRTLQTRWSQSCPTGHRLFPDFYFHPVRQTTRTGSRGRFHSHQVTCSRKKTTKKKSRPQRLRPGPR